MPKKLNSLQHVLMVPTARTVTRHVVTVLMIKVVTFSMEIVRVVVRLVGKEKSVYRVTDFVYFLLV